MSDESERAGAAARALAAAAREADFVEFVDGAGVCWRVRERDARADPGSRADWCLVFSCQDALRRVWDYTPDWRTLARTDLIALSWHR